MTVLPDLGTVRQSLGRSLFGMVAGPDGPANRARIHETPGPRWFGQDRPIRRVHADASMFVGGLRALLLQSLHPLAMAGVAQHSDYRGDPWGRLQRTSTFLAVTTFGPAADAQRAVDRVRGIHQRVHGVATDGRAYRASDPHLLEWVHIAEVDSFLLAHQLYGAAPLDQNGRDGYVADTSRVAAALGVPDPPQTENELRTRIDAFRPELSGTPAAREAARYLLLTPPLPLAARAPYGLLAATSVSMLPGWARMPLLLPYFPPVEATVIRMAGRAVVGGIRWAMTAGER
jgi:uncharacterized protein (DUF2236 family)